MPLESERSAPCDFVQVMIPPSHERGRRANIRPLKVVFWSIGERWRCVPVGVVTMVSEMSDGRQIINTLKGTLKAKSLLTWRDMIIFAIETGTSVW